MRILLATTIFILMSFSSLLFGQQTEEEVIVQIKQLVAEKKYNSAFTLAQQFDPENQSINITIIKTDLAINFSVATLMHKIKTGKSTE